MILGKPQALLSLAIGEMIPKRNLYDVIQFSKVAASPYWGGSGFSIGNTPQQGINWIGVPPQVQAVIIKTRPGSYEQDGWVDERRNAYRYSFKARKSRISYTERANSVLIDQPQYMYPVLLFTEGKGGWIFEGSFAVSEIEDTHVVLDRYTSGIHPVPATGEDIAFREGGRRYATHLLAERSRGVVGFLKGVGTTLCEICDVDFAIRYGIGYIEAHHKVPVASYTAAYVVKPSDLALLCPNCHEAVHLYMRRDDSYYEEIREKLRKRMNVQ